MCCWTPCVTCPRRIQLQIHGDPVVSPDYVGDLRRRAAGLPVRFMGKFGASQTAAISI